MGRIGNRFRRHPVLHELDMNLVDLAKLPAGNDLAGLPDHRIAGHHIAYAENIA